MESTHNDGEEGDEQKKKRVKRTCNRNGSNPIRKLENRLITNVHNNNNEDDDGDTLDMKKKDKAAWSTVPELEKNHVRKVYDEISEHWSDTRYKPWPKVVEFLASVYGNDPNHFPIILDVGCGNGKYFAPCLKFRECGGFVLGTDVSLPLLFTAVEKANPVTGHCDIGAGDCVHIPVRSNSVDACISIAVLHHLATEVRRCRAIQEIARVLIKGGRALIYGWAFEQPSDSKRKFPSSDVFVPWHYRERGKSYNEEIPGEKCLQRYCHVFKEHEMESLVKQACPETLSIEKVYYDQGNWCCILQRV